MTRIAVLLGALVVSVMLLAGRADAATAEANCTVTNINWNDDGSGVRFMNLICASGNVYWAFSAAGTTGCPQVSIDSVKLYQSLATASRLSGKPVTVWFNTTSCWSGSLRTLTAVEFKG